MSVDGIGPGSAHAIRATADRSWAADQIRRTQHAGFQILTLSASAYPPLLRQIAAPPPLLWATGNLEAVGPSPTVSPAVAMVGSRDPSDYGSRIAPRLAADLAHSGIAVVSGMAIGIDALCHRGALNAGGLTIAVLGSSLDNPYPAINQGLFDDISSRGIVVSEFPMGTPAEPGHFPRRNRIISGLSAGVVVVEARKRSGALITARYALEQNREVFAVPGRITSERSLGCHQLIRDGAVLVRSAADILDEIEHSLRPLACPNALADDPVLPDGLPDDEADVLSSLSRDTPLHIDLIATNTGRTVSQTLSTLLSLELQSRVEQIPGKRFLRKLGG